MGSSFLQSRLPAVVAAVLSVRFLAPEGADGSGGVSPEVAEDEIRPVFRRDPLLLPAPTSGGLFLWFQNAEGVGVGNRAGGASVLW